MPKISTDAKIRIQAPKRFFSEKDNCFRIMAETIVFFRVDTTFIGIAASFAEVLQISPTFIFTKFWLVPAGKKGLVSEITIQEGIASSE